jgi:hypothetical protein
MLSSLFYMKKYSLFGLTILALLLMGGDFAFADPDSGPKMVLKEQDFDFGEVEGEDVITHTFEVLNQGDEVLIIEKVSPG